MGKADPHSYFDNTHAQIRHANLNLVVDFENKILRGEVQLEITSSDAEFLDLDARGLHILHVHDVDGHALKFSMEEISPLKGERLRIHRPTTKISIRYETSSEALALQWLEKAQTTDQTHPYLFTQCQPIHARSIFPCQDTPTVRMTYRACFHIPSDLTAVMAADKIARTITDGIATEEFEMNLPIPSYLFAFAIGDIRHHEVGPRTRVYGEPSVLSSAAFEFSQVESMIETAEALFGPYPWGRFDILVMPSSFPYGGMENPKLTFLTPTVIAGDRSLVNIVAHELAHSWTGNLVTNATMNDFWLNEGFTTYAERRILEALEGEKVSTLHRVVGKQGLLTDLNKFGETSSLTCLKTNLENIDPDSVFSRIPYEKGYLFVQKLEHLLGRERFDRFLKRYMTTFRFRSITTEEFLEFLNTEHPGVAESINLQSWIYEPGLPEDAPSPSLERVRELLAYADQFARDYESFSDEIAKLSPNEWQILISRFGKNASPDLCQKVEQKFQILNSKNLEIRVSFLFLAINCGYEPAVENTRALLQNVGRMKYLRPLYSALANHSPSTRRVAIDIFERSKQNYHPVAANLVESLLEEKK
ncbi:MAG: M1 family metallopeptidase [Myxococcota bacterium]|nr:M1 family metallopeptidase [Myxococcota bacterium]